MISVFAFQLKMIDFLIDRHFRVLIIFWQLFLNISDRFEKLKLSIVLFIGIGMQILIQRIICSNNKQNSDEKDFILYIAGFFHSGLQIIITTLWTIFCTRWTIHSLHLKRPNSIVFYFTRYFGIFIMILLTAFCWTNENVEIKQISGYLPMITCLWYAAGLHITRRFIPVSFSVLIPTFYFYYNSMSNNSINNEHIDLFGLSMHSEQLYHHLVLSVTIVFVSIAFDKAKAILDIYYSTEHLDLRKNFDFGQSFVMNSRRMFKGLLADEIDFPPHIVSDLENCFACYTRTVSHLRFNPFLFSNGIFFIYIYI